MKPKRVQYVLGGPKVRPMTVETELEVLAGVLRSLQLKGYDWPVRLLRSSGDSLLVTLPGQVRNKFELKRGDWLAFGTTYWPGLLGIMKVTEAQRRIIDKGGRRALGLTVMKVQVHNKSMLVTVPKDFCRMVSAEVDDSVLFGLTPWSEVISMCVIKTRR